MNKEELAPRHSSDQMSLFSLTLEEFSAEMFVATEEMELWHRKGWLSFDPVAVDRYDIPERVEVLFIKGIARSDFSDAMIGRILQSLEKPYRYDPAETFFSFLENRWIGLPIPDPADITARYLTELSEDEDWDTLQALQVRISSSLESAERAEKIDRDASPGTQVGISVCQPSTVEWEEVEDAAKLAFSVWMGQPELIWAKQQWDTLSRLKLTEYQDEFDRYTVLFRLLVLGGIYRDFCDAAWEEYSEPNYPDWAEPLELDAFIVGQLYARMPDWEPNEEITKDEALEALAENERTAVVDALMRAFGGVSSLYASLWKSREAAEQGQEDDAEPDTAPDTEPDDDLCDDTYDPDASQMSAYSWVDNGCSRYR